MFALVFRLRDVMKRDGLNQLRAITYALVISGALNVGLIATLAYRSAQSGRNTEMTPVAFDQQAAPLADQRSNPEVLAHFRAMTFKQLVEKISSQQPVEDGYAERDLALACLVTFHDFNLAQALSGQTYQQRRLLFGVRGEPQFTEVMIYPGLTDTQYEAITRFAQTETWPVTPRGLFVRLKEQGAQRDPALEEAFVMTPQFQAVQALLGRAEVPVDRQSLLAVVLDCDWPSLDDFTIKQRAAQDLTSARRQRWLLDLVGHKSPAAAYMLLRTDGAYVAKKGTDAQVLQVLEQLPVRTAESERFATDLLTSPRSNQVWETAARLLYQYHGETAPKVYNHVATLSRFVPQEMITEKLTTDPDAPEANAYPMANTTPSPTVLASKPAKAAAAAPAKKEQAQTAASGDDTYVVQQGDSLWKIAKKHNTSVANLRQINNLKSDTLRPGKKLRVR
jgi:LysM repeat protein